MKLSTAIFTLSALESALAAAPTSVYHPVRVDYYSIVNSGRDLSEMMETLSGVGLVSVTNFPSSFKQYKKEIQAWTHACATKSAATKVHTFEDGTKRSTMATHSIPGPGGIQDIFHGDATECTNFDKASKGFRAEVDHVTRAFASRISDGCLPDQTKNLLETKSEAHTFRTVFDVVDNGEHLEHFHDYQGSSAPNETTVEWHTDQGLFLAFTPGVLTEQGKLLEETEGFYIELADKSQHLVQFGKDDDLIFMLGDGMNQVVNPSLNGRHLRAVPHALLMPTHGENQSRVWYGRMVLPPVDAVHPQHGETFGRLRQLLIESTTSAATDDEALALGCSSSSIFTHARQLEEASCEEGTLFCWHRCMVTADHEVSEDICSEENLDLSCVNPRGQLWDDSHGDWFPGCVNASEAVIGTPFDPLPDYPRSEEECTEIAHSTFVERNAANYEFASDLTNGGTFYWSVNGDKIKGMISYNGLLGYLGWGFSGNGSHNEMQRAIIMMASPSSVYSAKTGFDFDFEPSVDEYMIGMELAFRHWQTPVTSTARNTGASASGSYQVVESDCFTSVTFETPGIYNTTFNINGTDRLIWAANGEDMFAGYHGDSRGIFEVNWKTGALKMINKAEKETAEEKEVEDHEGHDHSEESLNEASAGTVAASLASSVLFFGIFSVL